jgi:erythromycin esterase-like protein
LETIEELQRVCEGRNGLAPDELHTQRLLLKQASAAIEIDLSQRDRWSSLGTRKELALYARIRTKLPTIDSQIASLQHGQSEVLLDYVRAAADLKRCQLRFRDEMNDEQRQAWRDAVRWGIENVDSDKARDVLIDLQQFLAVSSEYLNKPKELVNPRDESMAEFVSAILDLHGDQSRIALWAHDGHISKLDGDPLEDRPRMGTYLERIYGDHYLPVGLSFGSGGFQAIYYPQAGEDPARRVLREFQVNGSRYDSFSHLFDHNDAPVSAYVLNDAADKDLPPWFSRPHVNRILGALFQPKLEDSDSYYESMVLPEHFEIVMHVRKTERSRPLNPVPRFRFGATLKRDTSRPESHSSGAEGPTSGVTIQSIAPKSIAERCGLRAGDRIVRFAGAPITNAQDVRSALASIDRPGSHRLDILREAGGEGGSSEYQKLVLYLDVPPWINQ